MTGMQERPFGATGLMVTPIGLGLAALGRPQYINLGRHADLGDDRTIAAMRRRCHAMLDEAWAAGVGYVDAARSYGLAEQFLAEWLESTPGVVRPTIGSKWGYTYVGDWRTDATVHEVKDLSVEALRRQVVESRERLGSQLNLYQIHSATLESGVLDDVAVLRELSRLRSEGLVVGLTVSGPGQCKTIRRALQVQIDGVDLFQSVQATWNVLEPSASPALAEAHARGWGVIIKEALANGRLIAESSKGDGPLAELATSLDATRDTIAIAAALANPWADVVLSGAVTAAQLESNVRAIQLQLSSAHLEALAMIAEPAEEYWQRRSALTWS
jgi:aryl-alcohol dehydrogenase-like predicted oxidoreductase